MADSIAKRMARLAREDTMTPEPEDPVIVEAILNIQMSIQKIARIWEATRNEDLADAQANLEQAVRFLRGEEEPS